MDGRFVLKPMPPDAFPASEDWALFDVREVIEELGRLKRVVRSFLSAFPGNDTTSDGLWERLITSFISDLDFVRGEPRPSVLRPLLAKWPRVELARMHVFIDATQAALRDERWFLPAGCEWPTRALYLPTPYAPRLDTLLRQRIVHIAWVMQLGLGPSPASKVDP